MENQLGQKARTGAGRRKQDFAGDGFDPEGRDVPGIAWSYIISVMISERRRTWRDGNRSG